RTSKMSGYKVNYYILIESNSIVMNLGFVLKSLINSTPRTLSLRCLHLVFLSAHVTAREFFRVYKTSDLNGIHTLLTLNSFRQFIRLQSEHSTNYCRLHRNTWKYRVGKNDILDINGIFV